MMKYVQVCDSYSHTCLFCAVELLVLLSTNSYQAATRFLCCWPCDLERASSICVSAAEGPFCDTFYRNLETAPAARQTVKGKQRSVANPNAIGEMEGKE